MSTDINLSIVAAHDDLRRCTFVLTDGTAETGNSIVEPYKWTTLTN